MTATTQAAAKAATAPIAFMALAQHIEENKLLVPPTVTFPSHGDDKVTLYLDHFGAHRWVDSIQIDSERNEPVRAGWVRTTMEGRIPCPLGDVHLVLRFVREAPLQVVQS